MNWYFDHIRGCVRIDYCTSSIRVTYGLASVPFIVPLPAPRTI